MLRCVFELAIKAFGICPWLNKKRKKRPFGLIYCLPCIMKTLVWFILQILMKPELSSGDDELAQYELGHVLLCNRVQHLYFSGSIPSHFFQVIVK